MVAEMTRADPPLHLAAVLAAAMTLVGAACNSDDREQLPGTTTGTTVVDATMDVVWTTGEPVDSTSTGVIPPSPTTCRDGLSCASQCLVDISAEDVEAMWQTCLFTDCLEDMNHKEWLKLFDFIECVVPVCTANPLCTDGTDDECNLCYLQMLSVPPLYEGCDAEAAACK